MFKVNNKDTRLMSMPNLRLNQRGYAEYKCLRKDHFHLCYRASHRRRRWHVFYVKAAPKSF